MRRGPDGNEANAVLACLGRSQGAYNLERRKALSEIQDRSLVQQPAVPQAAPHLAVRVKGRPELEALLASVSSGKASVKLGAIKALRILSENAPDVVYPYFDFFASFLQNENSSLRWNSILLLGNLAPVDGKRWIGLSMSISLLSPAAL